MVWKKGNHQTEPITYWLLPPPLAPKDLRCFCDSKHLIFPKLQKSDILKGGGVGMELKQLHRADVSSYSSCQAQYRVSFTTLPLLSTIHL